MNNEDNKLVIRKLMIIYVVEVFVDPRMLQGVAGLYQVLVHRQPRRYQGYKVGAISWAYVKQYSGGTADGGK